MIEHVDCIVDWVFRISSLYCLILLVINSNKNLKISREKIIEELLEDETKRTLDGNS